MTYRDRVRLQVLRESLQARSGDTTATARLKELASQEQTARIPGLVGEIWQAVAESLMAD
ncbi:hypothetical protein [Streptomyces sp. NPDC048473]|uniref:hypothetical protein n=1 Tax=unclassified Streptomyces TaxID=2593676 RepID=UPI00371A1694